ncbi:MAG: ribosomal protein S18-alanine N-acetyltransferase [Desulfatibacillaceae bacterium]|nr:ribosomal protein S18-alanine N-acetyltransferase [Desulfatibacillaceae bacterium]
MKSQDLTAVALLEAEAFSDPWSYNMLAQELVFDSSFGFVIDNAPEGGIRAFAFFRVFVSEMHIMRIATGKAWRRMGLAGCLLASCLETARQNSAKEAFLEVRASNEAARLFYQKHGFDIVGIRKGYYPSSGEAALILKKKLE